MSVTEVEIPAHSAEPPLHTHDFDEAFYMLEGELIFQGDEELAKGAGELPSPRATWSTRCPITARRPLYVLVCAPAGFERHWVRLAAEQAIIPAISPGQAMSNLAPSMYPPTTR
jgi:hypothetical protein